MLLPVSDALGLMAATAKVGLAAVCAKAVIVREATVQAVAMLRADLVSDTNPLTAPTV